MVGIFVSSVIDAPVDVVWSRIRDFNALPQWHPAIASSSIEADEPSDRVGCVRVLALASGGRIREQLLALSDREYACTYSILASPMPVENYVATLRLRPVTDARITYAEWSAEFDCPASEVDGLRDLIGRGVFQAGFDGLKALWT